jgi:thiol-disulfide isomerase/thioredoxin
VEESAILLGVKVPTGVEIAAPHFPRGLPWVNVATLRMDQQKGRPVLVEFWDFSRVNSVRTLPYLRAWHERYEAAGLRVIGVHTPGFEPSHGEDAVRAAVERLDVPYPVCVDDDLQVWELFGNRGWPARYLFDEKLKLYEQHYGEGGYADTERAIQELLAIDRGVVAPVRPEDDPEAEIVAPTPDQPGAWSGPYAAGGVWAVLSGTGSVTANGREVVVDHPGAYALLEHGVHTEGVLDLEVGEGVTCHATAFTPGVVSSAAR